MHQPLCDLRFRISRSKHLRQGLLYRWTYHPILSNVHWWLKQGLIIQNLIIEKNVLDRFVFYDHAIAMWLLSWSFSLQACWCLPMETTSHLIVQNAIWVKVWNIQINFSSIFESKSTSYFMDKTWKFRSKWFSLLSLEEILVRFSWHHLIRSCLQIGSPIPCDIIQSRFGTHCCYWIFKEKKNWTPEISIKSLFSQSTME